MDRKVVSELAPTGVLRVGVNLGNPVIAQADPAGGDPRGVGPGLGRELARRAGVPVRFVTYPTAGRMADAAKENVWDVAFLASDPARAADIAFSAAYVLIEGTYLVAKTSPLRTVAAVDHEGIRVAVGLKTAYDLFLTRNLKHATLVRAPTSQDAIELFLKEHLDAAAGVRQPLATAALRHPDLRVMDESFMVIGQAAGVPRGRDAAARYVADFIEEAKRSGLVEKLLRESGAGEASVAPPAR
jgi:polar amino acid transport system substrate-binding protein